MCCKKVKQYFSKHPGRNAISHLFIGIGLGILITYPFIGIHPLRWGVFFLALGVIGHLYASFSRK